MKNETEKILVVDIGGTKALIAIAEISANKIIIKNEKKYFCNNYINANDLIEHYFKEVPRARDISSISLGVAGAIQNNEVYLHKLNWTIEKQKLTSEFKFSTIHLLNDVEAMGYGIGDLSDDQLIDIREYSLLINNVDQNVENGFQNIGNRKLNHKVEKDPSDPLNKNYAVIAPGTGLGESTAVYCNHSRQHHVMAGESGQSCFAPSNLEQLELASFLLKEQKKSRIVNQNANQQENDPANRLINRKDYLRIEDLISGPGLENIYRFLQYKKLSNPKGKPDHDHGVAKENKSENKKGENRTIFKSSQEITREANNIFNQKKSKKNNINNKEKTKEHSFNISYKTIKWFTAMLASHVGDVALQRLPYYGIYLAGGLVHHCQEFLLSNLFLDSFYNKGNMNTFLQQFPIYIVKNQSLALLGAARYANLVK